MGAEKSAQAAFNVKSPLKKTQAAVFELKDLSGKMRSVGEFKGKVILLHFWASWCEPCKLEFPAFQRLSERFKDRGFAVIAVSEDSLERTMGFIKEHQADFPVLIDQYGGVMRNYKMTLIPASVVIGKDGTVQGTLVGPQDYNSMEAVEYFEKLMK